MATGFSTYSSVSSLINSIYEGSYTVLRASNILLPTVMQFSGQGLQGRKVAQYNDVNVRTVGESDDVTPTVFDKTLLSTLTPAIYGDSVYLSDMRIDSDYDNVRADAAVNLGTAFAQDVDTNLATLFTSLTGGAVGTANTALSWNSIFAAAAILQSSKVPGPYTCALHPYGWLDLIQTSLVSTQGMSYNQRYTDAMLNNANNGYFITPVIAGVQFVVNPNIAIDGSDDAVGAMYGMQAIAYDERRAFRIAPQRDESRGGGGWELNASLVYAYGVWRPTHGVTITHDATAPA